LIGFAFIGNAALAIISTLLVGGAARVIAGALTSTARARVASLAAACGYAVGKYSFTRVAGRAALAPAAAAVGATIAIIILWIILLRRNRAS
jgi:hypothetical protein